MSRSPTSEAPAESLGYLLLMLGWQLLVLLVPIFVVAILPLAWGLAGEAALLLVQILCVRLGWLKLAGHLSRLLTACVIGTGFAIGRSFASDWALLGAIVWIVLALAGVGSLENRLGLKREEKSEEGDRVLTSETDEQAVGRTGGSAWGGDEPNRTPEGGIIRMLGGGEIAMGGPVYGDYLFPDGVLLEGIGSSCRFSPDGRYFIATLPSRSSWGMLLLDRQARRVYRCQADVPLWEIDDFDATHIRGRHSPLVHNGGVRLSLQQILDQAEAVDLVPIADLWLLPDWQESIEKTRKQWPAGPGGQTLEGRLALPESLARLEDPLRPLRYPDYELWLEGQATGLLLDEEEQPRWRADGRALACRAKALAQPGERAAYWLWQAASGWQRLPDPKLIEQQRLSIYLGAVQALEEEQVWVEAELGSPLPNRGEYGEALSDYLSATETKRGHDAYGRIIPGETPLTRFELALTLGQATPAVRSLAMAGGARLQFSPQAERGQGQVAYRLQLGDWTLPGEWQLEHRVSSCGRYVALLPACDGEALAEQVVVADSRERRLLASPDLLVERLRDFHDGCVEVVCLAGLFSSQFTPEPLRHFDQPAPPAHRAATCYRERGYGGVCHELRRFRLGEQGLEAVPDWRLAEQPQAANADGDFILPAPHGRDAAWLRGAETEYPDNWLREQCARQLGYLLTASGCALYGVTPSLCWSDDGRYLALTRLLQWDSPDNDDPDHARQWQLWLLDVEQRTLRRRPGSLGHMPRFEAFTGDSLSVRVFGQDWDDPADRGRRIRLKLDELLALPAEALEKRGWRWHLAGEQQPKAHWQSFDAQALEPWRG